MQKKKRGEDERLTAETMAKSVSTARAFTGGTMQTEARKVTRRRNKEEEEEEEQ